MGEMRVAVATAGLAMAAYALEQRLATVRLSHKKAHLAGGLIVLPG